MAEYRRWRFGRLGPALGAAALGWGLHHLAKGQRRPGRAYLAGAPLLIAHRGGAALAPENTRLAFERALDWWRADILELDVQPTRDGEAVVFHDSTLDRTTSGTGPVAEHTLQEISALDAGYHFTPDGGASFPFRGRGLTVPTLAEILSAFPHARINIEIKDGRAQERVRASIREAGAADRVLVAAGKLRDRALFRRSGLPLSAAEEEVRAFVLQLRLGIDLYMPPVDAFQLPERWKEEQVVTPRLVRAAHARNIAVHVWTVDELEDMIRLLDWEVDGIITDRPDRLARLLHERFGRPLPPGPPEEGVEPFLQSLLGD